MKKFYIFFLFFVVLHSACSQSNEFETDGNGTITSYIGKETTVFIPEKIGKEVIINIGYEAFAGKNLTSLIIPDSIKYITSGAFEENNLTHVNIPNSVTFIEDGVCIREGLEFKIHGGIFLEITLY